jgi:ATP-dependent Clp protease, protease subunit
MPNQNKPIRCFDGSAKPHEPFWQWVNVESDQPELELYGVISEYSWFEDEVTPKNFKRDLYANGKGGPIKVRIDSPGGDVIAASTIRSIMSEYPGEITVQIDGMAASAAVIIAISASKVQIMDSAYMMIHDPAVLVFGAMLDIETLKSLHDSLTSIKDGIVPAYAARTGLSENQIANMMTRETWMSAREAVEYKFADEIITGGQKAKGIQNVAYVNALTSYENVPHELLNLSSQAEPSAADVERANRRERLRERIKTLS